MATERWPDWLVPLGGCVFAGDRAVWPPAQRPAETVSAALPVLQPPAPDQSAVPLPHLGLLQQRSQQGDPAAGDELRAAGFLHSGKHPDFNTVLKPRECLNVKGILQLSINQLISATSLSADQLSSWPPVNLKQEGFYKDKWLPSQWIYLPLVQLPVNSSSPSSSSRQPPPLTTLPPPVFRHRLASIQSETGHCHFFQTKQ